MEVVIILTWIIVPSLMIYYVIKAVCGGVGPHPLMSLITNSDSIIIVITIINITGKLRHRESNPFLFDCFCGLPSLWQKIVGEQGASL